MIGDVWQIPEKARAAVAQAMERRCLDAAAAATAARRAEASAEDLWSSIRDALPDLPTSRRLVATIEGNRIVVRDDGPDEPRPGWLGLAAAMSAAKAARDALAEVADAPVQANEPQVGLQRSEEER